MTRWQIARWGIVAGLGAWSGWRIVGRRETDAPIDPTRLELLRRTTTPEKVIRDLDQPADPESVTSQRREG